MGNKRQLIYVYDAKRAIEHADPAFSYVIDNVPIADAVEVVHAKWVFKYPDWYCSHCDGVILNEVEVYGGCMYGDINTVYSSYCPHCGARMDGDTK